MSALTGLAARLRALFSRRAADADLADEIRFHIEMETEKNVRGGMSPTEARRVALAHFGGVERVREEHRDVRRLTWIEDTVADVRFGARSLIRTPGVTIAVVLTLALGLGANAAIFSVLDRIFFRMPSAVVAPNGVVRLYWVPHSVDAGNGQPMDEFDYTAYATISAAVGSTARVAVYDLPRKTGNDPAGDAFGSFAGPNYFTVLGVRPALGRLFLPEEERVGDPADVMVLSYDYWQRRFGGDSSVIGKNFRIGDYSFTIVGVAQQGFAGVDLDVTDYWRPLSAFRGFIKRGTPTSGPALYEPMPFLRILARPAEGVSAQSLAARATTGLRRNRPRGWQDTLATIVPGSLIAARGPIEQKQAFALALRIAAVALIVLLIACANVANLLLARATERRREIAVRLAMGISRGRLVRMLFAESALMAVSSGVAALLSASWAGSVLRALLLPKAHWEPKPFGLRVIVFIAGTVLLVAFATALAPAIQSVRSDLTVALKSGAREGKGRRAPLRAGLVVAQSGLAALLVIGAGLFVRSLHNVASQRIGYDAERLVFVSPAIVNPGSDNTNRDVAARELADRIARLSDVERVALMSNPPFWGISQIGPLFRANGDSLVRPGAGVGDPLVTIVSSSFFPTVGMRILSGRAFQDGGQIAPREIVINQLMARQLWPRTNPIGQCVRFVTPENPCFSVVGVVENARTMKLIEEARPQYYMPVGGRLAQMFGATWVAVRARPERIRAVIAAVRGMMPRAASNEYQSILPMSELIAPDLYDWRLGAWLFTALGALAIIVAAMGVYSTLTYTMSQRTHEIGVRMALGARGSDVARIVVRSGVLFAALGIVLGAALALPLGRLVASLLYGISPRDPVTMVGAALVLLVVSCIAASVPAWRAMRVDPVTALRVEV